MIVSRNFHGSGTNFYTHLVFATLCFIEDAITTAYIRHVVSMFNIFPFVLSVCMRACVCLVLRKLTDLIFALSSLNVADILNAFAEGR